jgi:hypothetical protein
MRAVRHVGDRMERCPGIPIKVDKVPPGSFLLARPEDSEAAVKAGQFKMVATIPELDNAPNFSILQR